MAPGGSFFARILASLLNDVLVKGLAENPAFQRFAVRTSQQIKQMQKTAEDSAKAVANSPTVNEARKEASKVCCRGYILCVMHAFAPFIH